MDDRGFVLQDTKTKGENLGTRRIEYPKVKGLVVYPPKAFESSGHHLEGVIEANTLGMSGEFSVEDNVRHFGEPQTFERTIVETHYDGETKEVVKEPKKLRWEVRASKKPLRIAVDGLNRKAILHTID
ncbi:MAG: hypothetical protein KKD39_01560 [Candidatus Altiarchaeota archaeon]|nr:hypothetical protein [Candidatus Altiarchaeota archaeon]